MRSAIERVYSKLGMTPLPNSLIRKIIFHILWTVAGSLMPLARILTKFAPFSASLIAIAPAPNHIFAAVGALIGEILWSRGTGFFSGICSIITASLLRWVFSEWKKLSAHALFPSAVAFFSVSLSEYFLGGGLLSKTPLVSVLFQGLASALAAFCLRDSCKKITVGKAIVGKDLQTYALFSASVSVFLLAAFSISVFSLNLGHLLIFGIILFFAVYSSVANSCVAGIFSGLLIIISTGATEPYLILSASAVIASLFSGIGKFAVSGFLLLSVGIGTIIFSSVELTFIYEAAISSIIFVFIPQKFFGRLAREIFPAHERDSSDMLRRSVVERLRFISDTVAQISDVTAEVSHNLLTSGVSSLSGVYEKAITDVCSSCSLRMRCWDKNYSASMDSVNRLTPTLLNNGFIKRSDISDPLAQTCIRSGRLAASISGHYEDFIGSNDAQRRLNELQITVSSQFSSVSEILREISDSFCDHIHTDLEIEREIREYLESVNLAPRDILCKLDRQERISIELVFPKADSFLPSNELREELKWNMEQICGRAFAPLSVVYNDKTVRILCTERPMFSVTAGKSSHSCNGANLCGDHCESFSDGNGHMITILSDGMGSGGRAAVDSSLTCGIFSCLIKSGLGFDSTLRIINSVLYTRTEEESLSTLDVASLDLFTGRLRLLKAGAPVSYMRKGNEVSRIELASLPAGILRDVSFSSDDFSLSDGDVILLVSDGALADGDEWILSTLRDWEGSAQELSDTVVKLAYEKRHDSHDDDISAAALQIFAA